MAASGNSGGLKAIGKKLLFSLVPVLVLLGALEIGLRALDWPPIEAAFEHNRVFWQVDPNLSNFPMPHNEEGTTFPVSTSADSLRPPFHDRQKPAGRHRVMALGCSTTFGWGVADDETWPARLEQYAHEAGFTDVEVINGGQPGYTTFQGRLLWDKLLKDYDPDVVLLGYVVQDARKAAYSDKSQAILQQDASFLKNNILYKLRIYLWLRSILGDLQIKAKERGQGDQGGVHRVPPEDYVENLRALVSAVKAEGATPVLFGYPLEREGYTEQHRRILKAAAEELGVPHFDPQPEMEQASRQAELYFPRDKGHANAAGNAWIARAVFDFLEQNDLLGKKGS